MSVLSFVPSPACGPAGSRYVLRGDALLCISESGRERFALSEVRRLHLFTMPRLTAPILGGATLAEGFTVCVVTLKDGRRLDLSGGPGRPAEGGADFAPFAEALVARTAEVNPLALFIRGMPPRIWTLWAWTLMAVGAAIGVGAVWLLRSLFVGGDATLVALGLATVLGLCLGAKSLWRLVLSGRSQVFDPTLAEPVAAESFDRTPRRLEALGAAH